MRLTHAEQREWSHGLLGAVVTFALMFAAFGCSGGSGSGATPPSASPSTSASELTGTYEGTFNANHLNLWLADLSVSEVHGEFATIGPGPIRVSVRGTISGEVLMLSEVTTSSITGEWQFWATIEEFRLVGAFVNSATGASGTWEVAR